jgi:hypothetical protein
MFVNKWTVQLNYPGELVEEGFDSQEELMAYVRQVEAKWAEDLHPVIKVLDPRGEETSITLTETVQ